MVEIPTPPPSAQAAPRGERRSEGGIASVDIETVIHTWRFRWLLGRHLSRYDIEALRAANRAQRWEHERAEQDFYRYLDLVFADPGHNRWLDFGLFDQPY